MQIIASRGAGMNYWQPDQIDVLSQWFVTMDLVYIEARANEVLQQLDMDYNNITLKLGSK